MTSFDPGWPTGINEMARRIRIHDWSATSLGPSGAWSDRFKVMVEQILVSPLVATLVSGPERLLIYNDAAARLYGRHHPGALGRPLPETFPDGWATVAPFYERAFAGDSVHLNAQPLDTRGEGDAAADAFDVLLVPVREADGHVAHVHMTGFEVGRRLRAEAALRDSEKRLALAFKTLPTGIAIIDAEGNVAVANDDLRRFLPTGPTPRRHDPRHCAQWQGWDAGGNAVRPENFPVARALRGEKVSPGLQMLYHADNGDETWTNVLSAPLLDAAGRVNGAIVVVIDIDRIKRLQDQQKLLVAELQHRTRNLLAVVRNIARRSIDPSPGRDQYDARLAALGRVQGFLSRSANCSVALAEIVAAELQAIGNGASNKIVVGGPPVQLPDASVQAVALALHELATNAVKYGAIGQPGGQLSVTWRLSPARRVRLRGWSLTGTRAGWRCRTARRRAAAMAAN